MRECIGRDKTADGAKKDPYRGRRVDVPPEPPKPEDEDCPPLLPKIPPPVFVAPKPVVLFVEPKPVRGEEDSSKQRIRDDAHGPPPVQGGRRRGARAVSERKRS